MIIKHKKGDIFPIFAVLLGIFGAGAFFLSSIGMQNRGGLSIRVVDAYDLTPVKNADIIIPSADIFAETDASGLAAVTLPIIKTAPRKGRWASHGASVPLSPAAPATGPPLCCMRTYTRISCAEQLYTFFPRIRTERR